jgi:epoxyqueuosine reductase
MGIAWRLGKGLPYSDAPRLAQLEAKIAALAPGVTTKAYVDTGPTGKARGKPASADETFQLVRPNAAHGSCSGDLTTWIWNRMNRHGSVRKLHLYSGLSGAIIEPYVVDARLCISYLTIELRGGREVISDDLAAQMGNRIFGCDDCLDVCPFNLRADATSELAFAPTPLTLAPNLKTLAQISEESFLTTFKESPLKRAKQSGLIRNVGIAQENHTRQAGGRAF